MCIYVLFVLFGFIIQAVMAFLCVFFVVAFVVGLWCELGGAFGWAFRWSVCGVFCAPTVVYLAPSREARFLAHILTQTINATAAAGITAL